MSKAIILCALLLQACAITRVPLPSTSAERVAKLEQAPDEAGELIYEGQVFDPESSASSPAFRYERRVIKRNGLLESTHITTDLSTQKVAVIQSAVHTPSYELRTLEQLNAQTGAVSRVTVTGRSLHYVFHQGDTAKEADELVDAPIVVGPTLFGFIAQHWAELEAGKSLPVLFVVIEGLTSYPFTLRKAEGEVLMEGSGLVALAVKPQHFLFDPAQKRITRYTGRAPQRRVVDGALSDLDARVEYTHHATYR